MGVVSVVRQVCNAFGWECVEDEVGCTVGIQNLNVAFRLRGRDEVLVSTLLCELPEDSMSRSTLLDKMLQASLLKKNEFSGRVAITPNGHSLVYLLQDVQENFDEQYCQQMLEWYLNEVDYFMAQCAENPDRFGTVFAGRMSAF